MMKLHGVFKGKNALRKDLSRFREIAYAEDWKGERWPGKPHLGGDIWAKKDSRKLVDWLSEGRLRQRFWDECA